MNKFSIKHLFLVILLLVNNNKVNAQHKNDFEAGLFNIGFGGFVGGIGAIINKKPNQKTAKVFLKGFGQGALGGYLLFESKRLVGKFAKTGNYGYVWPSKLINSAGVSIIENAASNRDFWDRWHLNIGFNRIEFQTKNKFKVNYKIMPFALGNTIYGFTQGKLNISESVRVGSFVFTTEKIKFNETLFTDGRTFANSIILIKNPTSSTKEIILAHEIIHVYQYESFSGLNPFLNKPLEKINIEWAKKYHKIFYTDYNYLINGGLYLLNRNHGKNFFENEARYYTE